MMTCSIPAATASSTAYWMIGLSTSGSISLGWALVAGRKRVPHPAAGKTAFRTRIEPHGIRVWAGRASIAAVSRTAGRGGSGPVGFRYLPAERQTPAANGGPRTCRTPERRGTRRSGRERLGEPADRLREGRGTVEIREVCRAGQADAARVVGA